MARRITLESEDSSTASDAGAIRWARDAGLAAPFMWDLLFHSRDGPLSRALRSFAPEGNPGHEGANSMSSECQVEHGPHEHIAISGTMTKPKAPTPSRGRRPRSREEAATGPRSRAAP